MLKSFTQTIDVAACDIRHGVPKDCGKCPIARRVLVSLSQRFRRWNKLKVQVGGDTIDVTFRDAKGKKHLFEAKTPIDGVDFIGSFDALKRKRVGGKMVVVTDAGGVSPAPFTMADVKFTRLF